MKNMKIYKYLCKALNTMKVLRGQEAGLESSTSSKFMKIYETLRKFANNYENP